MPALFPFSSSTRRWLAALASVAVLATAIDHAVALPLVGDAGGTSAPLVETLPDHLLVSEVMTGGASASDEFIELYNPADATLSLEGLEVVYVTASGATVTRKATWSSGTPGLAPGAHLLLANEAGIFAGLADVVYASGLAGTGGSVALRVVGAATAIDAVGWGNATSTWLETRPAPAPASGSSLERLPGGSLGSGQDTDDNLVDFAIQPVLEPQNTGSPPVPAPTASPWPSESPDPSPSQQPNTGPTLEPTVQPTAEPTVEPTPTASPLPAVSATETTSPSPTSTPAAAISIADARAQPDGSVVTVEGFSLMASDFTDGGGYLIDASAGIAVLISDGSFSRGELLRVTGTLDDRYAQRTIRSSAAMVEVLGAGSEPLAVDATTGSIGEGLEGSLVEVTGLISSSATTLSTGIAWDLDDGSGAARVVVGTSTGIDTSSWARGVGLTLIGVVGQRDSSGSGTSGFRIQPRDPADILAAEPIATPSPTPPPTATPGATASSSPAATASPTPGPSAPLVSISEARAAATGTHLRIRGVVTAQSGLLETGSAIVQDATAGILIRLGTDVGSLALGQLVELDGTRATKAGMLSLRVTTPPLQLGSQADPGPQRRATGALGEPDEARLVIVRGAVSTSVSRPRGGNVSFALDDGSGRIRVTISSRAGIDSAAITKGTWIELRAVLAQETTGTAPQSGYRLWPRTAADLRVIAAPVAGAAVSRSCCAAIAPATAHPPVSGVLEGTAEDVAALPETGVPPTLARAIPTGSPRSISTATGQADALDTGSAAGGLVVSGMGLAALAGLAAWLGRRRAPDGDVPGADEVTEGGMSVAPEAVPHLSVLRVEAADARKRRRILPPT